MAGGGKPCGACRALRRKCMEDCLLAPYFSSDKIGQDQFGAILEVFGHSRFNKLFLQFPVDRRHDAVASILYEAHARILDPVHGCCSAIRALQQEIENLRQQLAVSHAQLAERRSLGEVNNYQLEAVAATADECSTSFPMCMERGCMKSDLNNFSTVQQIDTEIEMEMAAFHFGQDGRKSTQERQSNFIVNPGEGGLQARTCFPSFQDVHNLHF